MCVFICWSIWKARNDLVFRGSHHSPTDTVASALNFHGTLNEAISQPQQHLFVSITSQASWSLPLTRMIKMNFDAALSNKENKKVAAVVARNHNGQIIS